MSQQTSASSLSLLPARRIIPSSLLPARIKFPGRESSSEGLKGVFQISRGRYSPTPKPEITFTDLSTLFMLVRPSRSIVSAIKSELSWQSSAVSSAKTSFNGCCWRVLCADILFFTRRIERRVARRLRSGASHGFGLSRACKMEFSNIKTIKMLVQDK